MTTLREGDRVLASCITSCGRCASCREGRYGLCTGGGGWILGHLIDGVQAEYARIPFADTSAYRIPATLTDEQVLFLADILPTSYEVGVLAGGLRPGDTVAIVGAGPIGLAAVLTANLYTPRRVIVLDPDRGRLDRALDCGATDVVAEIGKDALDHVLALTDGVGVDLAIEAVGVPETFELCTDIVRAGGNVANVGVHGKPATLHLERLWIKDVTITMGLVDTCTTPRLMQLIAAGKLDPSVFATHRFSLDEAMTAYDAFTDAKASGAFKVVLEGAKHRQVVPAEATLVAGGARQAEVAHHHPGGRTPCDRPAPRCRVPRRPSGWSRNRYFRDDRRPRTLRRLDAQPASDEPHALAHADEPEDAVAGRALVESAAVVLDHRCHGPVSPCQQDAHVRRVRVLDDVRKRLLDDAVERRLHLARQPFLAEPRLEVDPHAGALAERPRQTLDRGGEAEVVERRRTKLDREPAHPAGSRRRARGERRRRCGPRRSRRRSSSGFSPSRIDVSACPVSS